MKEIKEKLKDILGRKYFIFGECMIDSLIRIEDDNYDRCVSVSECYYGMYEFACIKVCNSHMEEDLKEVI